MDHELTETTGRQLTRIATRAQRDSRTPALVAGVAHRGRLLWETSVGTADLDDPSVALGVETQFAIASNTKTFTAVLVMALRDEGRLALDDEIETHLPGSGHPGVTVRQLLAHSSGLQREPLGDIWETLGQPEPADPVANLRAAERVLAPHDRWHYSNLAYMVLGELVARLDGRPWAESLQARLLGPLGLRATTLEARPPAAGRYYVAPFTDVPIVEPTIMRDVTAPVGGLFSTVADLVRWHAFLLAPDPAILAPDTAQQMRQPQITVDPSWSEAWGLGLDLVRRERRVWFGHTGGTPGAISGAFSHAESGMTSIVLMNNSVARDPAATAVELATHVLEHDPPPLDAWVPGTSVPDELAPLVGLWFSEGEAFVFSVRHGRLQARLARDGAGHSPEPAVFVAEGEDAFRTVAGRERGERLLVRRGADGSIAQLNWATYRFTREPLGFAQTAD